MSFKEEYKSQFSVFHDLMQFKVREILLVSSLYDAFVLEEDGRLSEKILNQYLDLDIKFVPRITSVSSATNALKALGERTYDLVITMTRISDMNPITFGQEVKHLDPDLPVILLTYDWVDDSDLLKIRTSKCIDKIFYWAGDTKILLAIIKFVEDIKNLERDVKLGVRVILIIEDSPKYYSLFIPLLYTEILGQTRRLIMEGINSSHRLLRNRARPKIVLAESYEEGMAIYNKYRYSLLGIISDVKYPRGGVLDPQAGFILAKKVREEEPHLPVLLQSSNEQNRLRAFNKQVGFLHKNSENLLHELRTFILSNFGFGDFVFKLPDNTEIDRAKDLHEFEKKLKTIPEESLKFHAERNHFSTWMRARTEFALADKIRPMKVADYESINDLRKSILWSIQDLFHENQVGVIADFDPDLRSPEHSFIRLGKGSLGGKARSIAFINALLAKKNSKQNFEKVEVKTPQTFVICSDVYEHFIEKNQLLDFALTEKDNRTISKRFIGAKLPKKITKHLKFLLEEAHYPIAVRSSSILEDSQTLPFAGLYSTYMLPNNHPDIEVRLQQLCRAIKLVFASVFFKSPKEYVKNSSFRLEEEKMAIIIQEIVGESHDQYYYPVISGVAQSYNFYPFSYMEPDDGIVHLALGLGMTIVEGEQNLFRFSPKYPALNPPYSSIITFIKNSQNFFYAMDLADMDRKISYDQKFSLKKLSLAEAEKHDNLFFVASTYSPQDDEIRDTTTIKGIRVVTFANVLKYNAFPMAEILEWLLKTIRHAFGSHVEIEFAVNPYREQGKKSQFYLLQVRPMVAGEETVEISLKNIDKEDLICSSEHSLGNGIYRDLYDLVYVDPDTFNMVYSREIAKEIGQLNQYFIDSARNYILMGFGRWGTTDPWLGIPVEWSQISRAKVIVESNMGSQSHIEPSQGTHFFHNLISLKLGYLHVFKSSPREYVIWDWIQQQEVVHSTNFVKHVRFQNPMIVKIDGRLSKGVILKPNGKVFLDES